jgi:hypothetical protein
MTKKYVKTYDYVSKIISNVPSGSCYQGDYEMFPGIEDKNTDITYTEWMTPRSTLKKTVKPCSAFFKSFSEKLNILLHHSNIA